jgi:hypothetical protein
MHLFGTSSQGIRIDDRWPYVETKEQLGGILILEARDLIMPFSFCHSIPAA